MKCLEMRAEFTGAEGTRTYSLSPSQVSTFPEPSSMVNVGSPMLSFWKSAPSRSWWIAAVSGRPEEPFEAGRQRIACTSA